MARRRRITDGLPNRRPTKHEATEIAMASAEYEVRRRREKDARPYRGSEDELHHRLRKPWGRKK